MNVVVIDMFNQDIVARRGESWLRLARKNPDNVAQIMTNADIQCRILASGVYRSIPISSGSQVTLV